MKNPKTQFPEAPFSPLDMNFHPLEWFRKTLPRLRRKERETSFTLIELLVVVTIISLLAALLLPALKKAKFQAKRVKCMSNVHNLGLAIQMYANDNDGYLPSRMNANGTSLGGTGGWVVANGGLPINIGMLYPYVRKAEVFYCPAILRSTSAAYVPNTKPLEDPRTAGKYFDSRWVNENSITNAGAWAGYSMNSHMQYSGTPSVAIEVTNPDSPPPGGTVRLSGTKLDWNRPPYCKNWYPILACLQAWTYEECGAHEGKGSNILFCDGRVAWLDHDFKVANEDTVGYWNYGAISGYLPTAWTEVLSLYNK